MSRPRVTEILTSAGFIDDRWFTEYSRDLGTAFHRAVRYAFEGTLDRSTVDPRVSPFLDAALEFRRQEILEVYGMEVLVEHPAGWIGHLDLYARLVDSIAAVIDYKTGAELDWHALQVAAYSRALDPTCQRSLSRYTLYLRPESSPPWRLVQHTSPYDWPTFQAAFTCHAWKLERGLITRRESENGFEFDAAMDWQ